MMRPMQVPQIKKSDDRSNTIQNNENEPNKTVVEGHSLPNHPSRNGTRSNWRKNINNNNRSNFRNNFRQDYSFNKKIQQETLFVANLPHVDNDEEEEDLKKELLEYLNQFCTVEKLQLRNGRPSIHNPNQDIRLPIVFALLSPGDTVVNVIEAASKSLFRQSLKLRLEVAWNQKQVRLRFDQNSVNLDFFRQSHPWCQEPQKFFLLFNNSNSNRQQNINWKLIREICSVFGSVKVVLARHPIHSSPHSYVFDVDFEDAEDSIAAFQTLKSFQNQSGIRAQMRGQFMEEYQKPYPPRFQSRSIVPLIDSVSPESGTPVLGDLQSENGQDLVSNSQSPTTPKNEVLPSHQVNTPQGLQQVRGGMPTVIKPRLSLQTSFNTEPDQQNRLAQTQVPMMMWSNNPMMNRGNHAGVAQITPTTNISNQHTQPVVNMNAIPIMPAHLIHPSQGVYMGNMIQNINGAYHQVPMVQGMPMHFVPYQMSLHLPGNIAMPNQQRNAVQPQNEGGSQQRVMPQERMEQGTNVPPFYSSTPAMMHNPIPFPLPHTEMMPELMMERDMIPNFNSLGLQDQSSTMENDGQIHIPAWQSAENYY